MVVVQGMLLLRGALRVQVRRVTSEAEVKTLPRLPVPSLENLQTKYLASLAPFYAHDADAWAQKTALVHQFVTHEGRVLQQRLQAWDASQPHSWLEALWLRKAYLEWREPSLVNVNWWAQFRRHPE